MREAVIVASSRTPLAKSFRGSFNLTRPDDFAAHCIKDVLGKVPQLDPTEVEDVILGCGQPHGPQGHNIARVAAVRAGLPVSVGGLTVNRFCSSGLQAIAIAWRPEEQKRFTVRPPTLTGSPARTAATRAMLWPCGPWGWPQPRITSSTSVGSSCGTLPRTSLMQWAAKSSGRVRLNEPRNDLASGVRELATMTASRMTVSFEHG